MSLERIVNYEDAIELHPDVLAGQRGLVVQGVFHPDGHGGIEDTFSPLPDESIRNGGFIIATLYRDHVQAHSRTYELTLTHLSDSVRLPGRSTSATDLNRIDGASVTLFDQQGRPSTPQTGAADLMGAHLRLLEAIFASGLPQERLQKIIAEREKLKLIIEREEGSPPQQKAANKRLKQTHL